MRVLELRNMLAGLSSPRLRTIAQSLGLGTERNLIPSIVGFLSDPDMLAATVAALPPPSRVLLRDLLYIPSPEFHTPRLEAITAHEGFPPLYSASIVAVGRDYWGSQCLVLPEESRPHLLRHFLAADAEKLSAKTTDKAGAIRANTGSFLRNIATLIAIAEEKGLELTQQGEIAKPFLRRQILPFMELPAAENGEDRYPEEFADVFHFARTFKLLEFGPGLATAAAVAPAFLGAPEEVVATALRFHADRRSEHLRLTWLIDLLAFLPDPAVWTPVSALIDTLLSGLYPARLRAALVKEWQASFRYLENTGIVEAGSDEANRPVVRLGHYFRRDQVSARTGKFYVTPDFKITAPRNLDFATRHRLFQFARFIKADVMDQWEMTRESISGAVDNALGSEEIVGFLEEKSSVSVPQNVASSVQLWAADHANVRFYNGPVLIVDDPAEQRLLRSLGEAEHAIIDEPAANVFLLKRGKAEEVLKRIRARRSVNILRSASPQAPTRDFASHLNEIMAAAFPPNGKTSPQMIEIDLGKDCP